MRLRLLLATTVLTATSAVPSKVFAQPVSGVYIGAGGGANFMQQQRNDSVTYGGRPSIAITGSSARDTGVTGVASVGYGFGNGLRIELEGDYRYNRISKSSLGYVTSDGGREQKYGSMVNLLFDLDIGSPYVFPYIGGGGGYSWVDEQQRTTGALSVLTPTGLAGGPAASVFTSGVDSSFAYQAIAGLSFPVPPVVGLSLTAEYRYFALAGDRTFSQTITGTNAGTFSRQLKVTNDYNHSLMLGLRYAFNVAPPPVEDAAPAPAPQSQVARTYQVFFDWDHSDLTDRARQILSEAAKATTRVQVTRIDVSGYTDTSGSRSYNQGLSQRRAETVAGELVRLGVPRASISTQAYGETHLLVPTGANVREPQNRRVEIILH